uniref:ATP-dependent DNA helicase n=1 Tax=Amphimedon queenslandica TaxID=400682 RepID=A0A1X7UCH2_AMPQE
MAGRGHMQDLWQDILDDRGIYSKLFRIGIRCLDSRPIGLYETCDILLGEPLCRKSREVLWIDVEMPHKRKRNLTKKLSEVEKIAANDPSTEDFYGEGLVTHFYPNRAQEHEEYCLYDFVAKLTYKGKNKNGERIYKPLQIERLPNFIDFDVYKENQRDNFYYAIILLFVPFRNEDELVHDGETVQEAFDCHIVDHERCVEANEKYRKLLKCREKLKDIQDARAANREEENDVEDDDPQLMGQIKDAINDVRDMDTVSGLTLQERESMLNVDQKRIFDHVKAHLLRQIEYKNKSKQEKEQSKSVKPLHMFISGVGGTALVKSLWSPLTKQTCAVCAPTGLAAYNVGGVTAHRLFQLPIEHDGQCASYWSIPKASHKVMKTELQDLKMVIIDEVSMVSSLNLTYIHMRMNDLFESDEWFGGKNVLFVGDILQLPPVRGQPVFDKVTASTLKYRLGSMGAVNIWRDTVTYDELTINERQKTDQKFSEMLDKVRRGFPDDETLATLSERGLVNGALGTVQAISETRITVKFDRITDPCEIEKVKRKFMVMKNVFVYRSQFPLILAFAVTIHKGQGLSLDNAIIDLSENVFSAGMAYVALSRVRTLCGVHFTCFNPKSLMVSPCSKKEINSRKRTLTGTIEEPQAKNQKNMPPPIVARDKRSRPSDSKNNDKANCPKKPPTVIANNNNNDDSDDCVMMGMSTRASNLKYHPPNAATQKAWFNALNLGFVKSYRPKLGSPTTELTVPKGSTNVPGDGNCLFNALSHPITGSYI